MNDGFKFLDEKALSEMLGFNDLTMVVLKGHLIIERILNGIVASHCNSPIYLSKARLTFSQMAHLAQSLMVVLIKKGVFPAIHNLNKLRNYLAHSLDTSKTEELADKFVVSSNLDIEDGPTVQRVRDCICQIVCYLQAFGFINNEAISKEQQGSESKNA